MKIVKPGYTELSTGEPTPENVMKHIEHCGRVCYKSEDKITPGSAEKFCTSIIKRGHTSVLEHANLAFVINKDCYDWWRYWLTQMELKGLHQYIRTSTRNMDTFYISGNVRAWRDVLSFIVLITNKRNSFFPATVFETFSPMEILFSDIFEKISDDYIFPDTNLEMQFVDYDAISPGHALIHQTATIKFTVDRGISHEIVRHRTASFSQESTRYCNYGKGQFNGEITVVEPNFFVPGTTCYGLWENACKRAESMYFSLLNEGCSPQQARDVLPISTKTEIVMTDTYDHWRHFLELRTSPAAHPQIREVAVPLLEHFKQKSHIFDDISL